METLGVAYPAFLEITGPGGEKKIALEDGATWRMGRSDTNQIVIKQDLISRNHAMIQRMEAGRFYLIDLGSRNGSFVNGARVSVPMALKDSDRIALGDYQMVFHQASTPVAAPSEEEEGGATKPLYVTRLITVLVVDIRDFTGISQRVPEGELCQMIGTWFNHASNIMQQHGSWAQKYIGDAVMAVWMHRDRAREAAEIVGVLRALAAFVTATAALPAQLGFAIPLRIGAGINTGFASMGNTGSGIVTDYTALGTTVNAAFRLESATKELACDLAVGEGTFERLKTYPQLESLFQERAANLKGFEGPSRAFAAAFDGILGALPSIAAG
jgi:adenylate cyclase